MKFTALFSHRLRSIQACSALLIASLGCTLVISEVTARTFRDPYGGSGTDHASDECTPGKYFVGVVGATGAWIDQIAVLCAEAKSDGTFGPAKTIASRGGTGGALHPAVLCPRNQVITQIRVWPTEDRQVASLDLACVGGNVPTTELQFGGTDPHPNGGHKWDTQNCLKGEAATGLNINYGRHVNGIGIICDTFKIIPGGEAASAGANPPQSCPEGQILHQGKCEVVGVLPGTTTGTGGGFIPMIPEPLFVTVLLDVDAYTKPGGADEDRKKDANGNNVTLTTGTQSVTVLEKKAPWFHVKWPGQDGWVYSGSGYVSLKLP